MKVMPKESVQRLREQFDRANEHERLEMLHQLLYFAYLDARRNKLATNDEALFEKFLPENLYGLAQSILDQTYRPSRGIAFIVKEPVIREIFAASFRDRISHHFLFNLTDDFWDGQFIDDSYSCRVGKGTDYGIRRLYEKIRKVSKNFTIPTVVLKFDVRGYFMSLPREGLSNVIQGGLLKQFDKKRGALFDVLLFLWEQIIFDDPTDGVEIRGNLADWRKLPPSKSLFCQPPGQGIVIGNLTSQLLSNVYLGQMDWFVQSELGLNNYGRYVDDFFFVLPESEVEHFMREVMPQIEAYLNGLGLKLHPNKKYCQRIEHGVPFLGVRIYPWRILPDYRIRRNVRRTAAEVEAGEKDIASLISYLGRTGHMDAQRLLAEVWAENGWDWQFTNLERGSRYFGV